MPPSDFSLDSTSAGPVPRILPEGGHEIPAILLISMNGQTHVLGSLTENLQDLPDVLVRLGTKVSDAHPSSVGFRVFLRTEIPNVTNGSGTLEDHYHVFSCRSDPERNALNYSPVTEEGRETLSSYIQTGSLSAAGGQVVYRMDFKPSDTESFLITSHGPELQCVNRVRKIEKMVFCIAYASIVSLFFGADEILVSYLERAIKNGCIGELGPSWKDNLPESATSHFLSNPQTRMVAGSTDILNILNVALRDRIVTDGPLTSIEHRPQARRFKEFVQATYPFIREEASAKVYPIMLNVTDGLCLELPFGASFYNKENVYTGINALRGLMTFEIPGEDIGIVAFYPAQAEAYRRALKQYHHRSPDTGYDAVKVDIIENWIDKEIGITIIDLVRTANASGNLGHLSQARRVKLALTIHRNGMIFIGDRKCTINSIGKVTTTKLDKVLEWFQYQGRIVDSNGESIGKHVGQPQNQGQIVDFNRESVRKHVGHSPLETLTALAPRRGSNQSRGIAAITASFARQGFLNPTQNATSDLMAGASPRRTDDKAAVTDESRNLASHSASSARNLAPLSARPAGNLAPHSASSAKISTRSRARDSGTLRATEDAFARFQAQLKGQQGVFLPNPMAKLTENTRKKVREVNDRIFDRNQGLGSSYAWTDHFDAKSASVSPSIVSPSTSNEPLANPFAKSQAVTPQLSTRNLNSEQPRQQAETQVQKQPVSKEPSSSNDFNTQYRSKYKHIRAIFETLHRATEASPSENQLFRHLGEAYIMQDGDEFENIYTELLRLAEVLANGFAVSG